MPNKAKIDSSYKNTSQRYYRIVLASGLVVVVVLTSSAFALGRRQSSSKTAEIEPTITLAEPVQANGYGRGKQRGAQFNHTKGDRSLMFTSLSESEKQVITPADEAGIVKMREEEKLARDVYLTLANKYDLKVFHNIAKAEQTHMDAIGALMDKYEIKDPVTDDTVGVFSDPEMQQLYDELVAKGSQSTKDALLVGATIEDLDIYDLDDLMKETNNSDIKLVYGHLTWGSENHMRAFTRNLDEIGVTYQPQYISADRYETIINAQAGRGGRGQGHGRNMMM